jgi:hypothetical protein
MIPNMELQKERLHKEYSQEMAEMKNTFSKISADLQAPQAQSPDHGGSPHLWS